MNGNGALAPLSVDTSTLSQRASEGIREAIRDGRLVPGELYSVATLAEEFGVSRTPVREALLVLERQGMVRFERNRGVRVLETTIEDLSDIFGLRLLLEVPAVANACHRLDAEGRAALQRELAAMRDATTDGDEDRFMARDQIFHECILRASGNERLTLTVRTLRDHTRRRAASTAGHSRTLAAILSEHERIMTALEVGNPGQAAVAMRDHIVTTGKLLIEQHGGTEADTTWARWADPLILHPE